MLALLMLGGCGAKKTTPEPSTAGLVVAALPDQPTDERPDEDMRYGVYSLDFGEELDEYGNYDSDLDDENAIVVRDGAVLHMKNAGISKSGNGTRSLFSGLNAAAAVIEGASLLLEENSTVTANGLGAPGVFLSGEAATLEVRNSQIVTVGGKSPALVCVDGALARVIQSQLVCEGESSPLIMTQGDVSVSLSLSVLSRDAAPAIEVYAGLLRLELSDKAQLTGDIQLMAGDESPAGLSLILKDNASFTGAVIANTTDTINVSLDETSTWTLTGELTIAALSAPDTDFLGIQSNGFNIYYNADLAANAWLESQAYRLPGGGFLSPLI